MTSKHNVSLYSSDGKTWNETKMPVSGTWWGAAYGNGVFVVVGGNTDKTGVMMVDDSFFSGAFFSDVWDVLKLAFYLIVIVVGVFVLRKLYVKKKWDLQNPLQD
mmetsp:Transcript_30803/g.28036  ORF Transcript_30803/g.28036 Transcript_30803/m.28036 type:complete len:104 (-) Transcript_30803:210-521(-)